MKFEYYEAEDGTVPFEQFLLALPAKDRAKMIWTIQSVEALGLEVAKRQKWIKKLDDNLFELRSIQGNNIQRGFYFKYKDGIFVITHGFTKKTQKTPKKEIKRGIGYRSIYVNKKKRGR